LYAKDKAEPWSPVTVSIRRMSLGAGFAYLMSSVARGDGAAPSAQALTRYYLESGTPAGRFLGVGLAALDRGAGVSSGTVVTEEALWHLLGMMADPVSGEPLGRAPQRRRARGADTRKAPQRQPVAGFDLTCSAPKSVSVLWALADAQTQAAIHRAHRDAIDIVLGWAEANVAFTRTGAGGRVQAPVRGLVAAAFDHWDSRAGDPHLHTHVVVANRVQSEDGTWRSLDGATLFRYTVALSELHEGVLHDLLTERLGVGWATHPRQHSATPRWDLAGVSTDLLEEFSARTRAIAACKDELVGAFVAEHGRQPTNVETLKLRQRATLQTRPDKTKHSLAEQMATWRHRAAQRAAGELSALQVPAVDVPELVADSVDAAMFDALGHAALAEVSAKRAVFGEANLLAEVHRQLHGARTPRRGCWMAAAT
jgi:conjugative relaxase-like TrwC/TraI family protein